MRRAVLALLAVWLLPVHAIGGTWTPLVRTAPTASGGLMLLLTDGTVMCKSQSGGASIGNLWNKLTPDSTGSYANGTWTTLAPMADTRLYFSSQILKDGRVFVAGGEYGTGGAKGETYDPVTNAWTSAPAQGSTISDANSELLPDGRILVALVTGTLRNTIIFDPVANTWTAGPTANGVHNESAWVKLPDGSSLMVDRLSTNSERYIPALNQWVVDATVPVALYDAFGDETGPGFLLPDGRAFFIGSPSNTAYYTPSGNNSPGTWAAGPTIPGGQGAPDAAGAMMRDGKILCALSPTPTSANHFPSPTTFNEFDYNTNAFTAVTAPGGGSSVNISSYVTTMLVLPDGNVLYCQQGATQYYLYNPGAALAAGKPTVTTITQNGNGSYHLVGTQLNGISQGASYGDDWQMATNYPIIRITSGGNVSYCRTYGWSNTAVMTGGTPVTTEFTMPPSVPAGTYSLEVVANGIPSDPVSFTVAPVAPAVTSPTQANVLSSTATLGGNVTSDGGGGIIERGVVYSVTSVNSNPSIGGTGVTKMTSLGATGVFTVNVTGLAQGTGYSFKAFATNVAGTTYTTPASTFTTLAAVPLTGTKTVGTGGDYSSLTNSGGLFEAINGNGVNGLLSVQITADLIAETGTIALNALTGTTPSVKIFPTVAARIISGTSTGALIRLNAADNVTLDGSLGGTGTDRSLSVTNANTGTSSAVIWLQNSGTDGATSNTIRNLNVAGNGNTQTLVGIGSGSSTISLSSFGTGNNNNTIQNNSISKTQYGIICQGASAAAKNTGNVITQNVVNAASPNNVKFCGIRVGFENGIQITNNNISNLSTTNSLAAIAVGFSGVLFSTTSTTGNDVTNATITGNLIGSVLSTSATGYSAMGIAVSSVSSGTTTIANNIITGVSALSTSPDFAAGIFLGGGTGTSLTNVYYNSVSMTGTRGAATYPGYALAIGGTSATSVNVRNNALCNAQTSTGVGKSYAVGLAYSTYSTLTSDYNVLFVSGTSSVLGAVGSLSAGTAQTTLANWQATTGKDANSVFGDPLFTSTTDLHITSVSSPASNAGTPIAGLTTDFDGGVRSGTTPDIGADEFGLSNNADLASLGMTPGTFSPVFASATQGYFATVPNGISSLTVTPTVLEPNATVKVQVNGGPLNAVISGNPSGPLPLIVGANTINIVVTAQDTTTTKPYTITVSRQTVYQTWAAGFGVSTDPSASGGANLLSFSFGMKPGTTGALVYAGTFAGGGSIAVTGTPITMSYITNPGDVRALFVRRKDYVAAGLTYTGQFSPGVTSWSNSADVPAVMADDGINQIVSVPYPALLIGAGVAFFRVQVTIAP